MFFWVPLLCVAASAGPCEHLTDLNARDSARTWRNGCEYCTSVLDGTKTTKPALDDAVAMPTRHLRCSRRQIGTTGNNRLIVNASAVIRAPLSPQSNWPAEFLGCRRSDTEQYDPPRTRTWNLRLRRPTPYPLGQRALVRDVLRPTVMLRQQ